MEKCALPTFVNPHEVTKPSRYDIVLDLRPRLWSSVGLAPVEGAFRFSGMAETDNSRVIELCARLGGNHCLDSLIQLVDVPAHATQHVFLLDAQLEKFLVL